MTSYPYGYPSNRVIINDIDLTTEFQLVLIDGYDLNPPEPKFYTVDIPGGNGVIDLSESLGGDVAFKNREQTFTFKILYPGMFEATKTAVSNFLHGRYYEYKLTWDPAYTYRGRFSIVSYSHEAMDRGQLGEIVISVSADPYKYLPQRVYRVNAIGGGKYFLPSGRKPVRPVIQTERPTTVTFKGETIQLGVGTFRMNDFLFQEGVNELYVNTYRLYRIKWMDIGKSGKHRMTWEEARKYTFDSLQKLGIEEIDPSLPNLDAALNWDPSTGDMNFFAKAYYWNDISAYTWDYCRQNGWTWDGVNYNGSDNKTQGSTVAIITYEWGDL